MPWYVRWPYDLILWLALPLVWLRLMWRTRRSPDYGKRRAERLGSIPDDLPQGAVWFHSVSAGETIAVAPLIRALAERHPQLPVLVTTMTPTGSAQVQRLLGDQVAHCYAPYDFSFAVERFLRRARPRMLVLMETELWPNLIARSKRHGLNVLVINARLSARSARGYARIGWLTRAMLSQIDLIACQYPDHLRRFQELGLPADRGLVLGNVKFDAELPPSHAAEVAALRRQWPLSGPVWIAASTHDGEDQPVLDAHRQLRQRVPEAVLILVPRHPERFAETLALARAQGFATQALSEGPVDGPLEVLVGDTMGQLLQLYALADVAFVGGSLVPVGGHNPIEPALVGVPILMGPHDFNFKDVVTPFADAGCLVQLPDAGALADALQTWLAAPDLARQLGALAARVVREQRGAGERLLQLLESQLTFASDDGDAPAG